MYWLFHVGFGTAFLVIGSVGVVGLIVLSIRAKINLWAMKRFIALLIIYEGVVVGVLLSAWNYGLGSANLRDEIVEYGQCAVLSSSCYFPAPKIPYQYSILFDYYVPASPVLLSLVYLLDTSSVEAFRKCRDALSSSFGVGTSTTRSNNLMQDDLHSL